MCPVKKPCGPVDLRLIIGYREMELTKAMLAVPHISTELHVAILLSVKSIFLMGSFIQWDITL